MTEYVSDQVQHWTDVNESEVALTNLRIGQFNQIQNNGQIQSAVRNAQNYSGDYASVGQKLDGQVFGLKVRMEGREVYALIAVVRQVGTSGSNGYLNIKIKSTGLDLNQDGQVDANARPSQITLCLKDIIGKFPIQCFMTPGAYPGWRSGMGEYNIATK